MKCELIGCETEISSFNPIKPRMDGVLVQVLTTGKAYMICNNCAQKLGLIK